MDLCDKLDIRLTKCFYNRAKNRWSLVAKIETKLSQPPCKKPARFIMVDIQNEDQDFINKVFGYADK